MQFFKARKKAPKTAPTTAATPEPTLPLILLHPSARPPRVEPPSPLVRSPPARSPPKQSVSNQELSNLLAQFSPPAPLGSPLVEVRERSVEEEVLLRPYNVEWIVDVGRGRIMSDRSGCDSERAVNNCLEIS
jgi:hypothetical protein